MLYQIGTISQPDALSNFNSVEAGGVGQLIQLIFNLLIAGGAIYAVINFILAGYLFLSAGDDPKKMQSAWAKIWQTGIGLLFIAGSFLLAAIFGRLIFGDASFLLQPIIPTIETGGKYAPGVEPGTVP